MIEKYYNELERSAPQMPSQLLVSLLNKQPYRQMWKQYVQRQSGDLINARAVASHIAYELSDSSDQDYSPTQLKDRVRRALNGSLLTDETINLFAAAFGFNDQELTALWTSFIYHRYAAGAFTRKDPSIKRNEPYREYFTVMSNVVVQVDKRGLIKTMEVTEVIISAKDGLEHITPFIEASDLDIEILEGGKLVRLEKLHDDTTYSPHKTEYGATIQTPYPLLKDEVHRTRALVHLNESPASFNNRNKNFIGIGSASNPKFNLTTIVNFDAPPQNIAHCIWDNKISETPMIRLDLPTDKTSYSSHYPIIHQSCCGFIWDIVHDSQSP